MASEPKRYSVALKPSAAETLAKLSVKDQRMVAKRIEALAETPRPQGVEKMKGEANLYRVRSGDYRILYMIEDAVLKVLVLTVGNRKDIYRKR